MMKTLNRVLAVLLCVVMLASVGGVLATWKYSSSGTNPQKTEVSLSLNEFKYGTFYITKALIKSGDYSSAAVSEVGDVDISCDITLLSSASSSVTMSVTFYNNTDVSYYYDKTETVSTDNNRITYTVSGIEQKEEVAPRTTKTLYVTFNYTNGVPSDKDILSQLHFKFVIDKSSIGTIVAQTAVDRFRDILNNKVFDGSYQSLENAFFLNDDLKFSIQCILW